MGEDNAHPITNAPSKTADGYQPHAVASPTLERDTPADGNGLNTTELYWPDNAAPAERASQVRARTNSSHNNFDPSDPESWRMGRRAVNAHRYGHK